MQQPPQLQQPAETSEEESEEDSEEESNDDDTEEKPDEPETLFDDFMDIVQVGEAKVFRRVSTPSGWPR